MTRLESQSKGDLVGLLLGLDDRILVFYFLILDFLDLQRTWKYL